MAINCKQIKKFDIFVKMDSIDLIPELFSTFNGFKRFKRFKLCLVLRGDQQMIQQMYEFMNDLQLRTHFDELKDLTHFAFNSLPIISINENVLTDIDINLPNLQYLSFGLNIDATEWTAHILSRLSRTSGHKS